MTYDFHQLSPHDLELLVQDLLQAEWDLVLEGFKSGRDGGIDLRYARYGQNMVVQVKHYLKTGFAGLLRDLTAEAIKVHAIRPSRYVLATSVPLSPANKQAISSLFGSALPVADILGQEDLNNLLGRHPAVLHKHYKLWLASRAVLDRVLHSDLVTQSEFQVEKICATIRRNVRSDAYHQALEILDRDRVLIISGAPGVGKTTLANMLLYAHLEKNWQPVVIRRDIAEGQRFFQRGASQIYYYDDFMGATFLGERATGLLRNDDRAITDFIEMVRASSRARLILTTREHIFGQAMAASERLRQAGLTGHKMILHIGGYDFGHKAKILYNHLYFSDLPDAYCDALLASDFYLEIVRHPKFNPRLIEWLSSFNRVHTVPPAEYRAFVRNLMRDPSEVWLHAYEQQLSDAGRSLLLALYSLGGKTEGRILEVAFKALHEVRAARWGLARRPDDWATAMAELLNAFIRPSGAMSFEVLDPSVIDLLNAVVRKAPENAVDLVVGSADFSQIERVMSLAAGGLSDIWHSLRQSGPAVADAIKRLLNRNGRLRTFSNGTFLWSWTPGSRLAAVLPLADRLRTMPMLGLVRETEAAMRASWETQDLHVNDTVEALRALERTTWSPLRSSPLEVEITARLIEAAGEGVRSDELREIISALDLEGPENTAALEALRAAFERSRRSIAAEIGEASTENDFNGLREDYELFASSLGVDVAQELEQIEEAYGEYSGDEERRAEEMQDGYRDRQRTDRATEDSVRDMFASLRGDRGA
ncbi:restriction endonuclease [Rhodobacter sp. CZR27]|uniref:nSTAND3 domain-containing NTPase n=1 Tax=Rhodobacter sp. CZR27 TaxID=2033869 RepID=UPI000BBE6421|nr:restriction endonuclease [Rhodobacter sp. CZR27]